MSIILLIKYEPNNRMFLYRGIASIPTTDTPAIETIQASGLNQLHVPTY